MTILDLIDSSPFPVVAGGCARSLYFFKHYNEKKNINDIDVFFTKNNRKECDEYLLKNGYTNTFVCPKEELFSYKHETFPPVQLVLHKTFEDAKSVIDDFDLTVCMFAYTPKNKSFTVGPS